MEIEKIDFREEAFMQDIKRMQRKLIDVNEERLLSIDADLFDVSLAITYKLDFLNRDKVYILSKLMQRIKNDLENVRSELNNIKKGL